MPRPRIVILSHEVWPFVTGGGIGRHVLDAARLLAGSADVTVLTSAQHRRCHDELRAAGDPRLPQDVTFAWVEEPVGDVRPFVSWSHAWSAACCDALRALATDRPIDLVEIEDYRGIGAVAIDARRANVPEFARTRFALRLHTSWEMTAVLDHAVVDPDAAVWVTALERAALAGADLLIAPTQASWRAYRHFYGELLEHAEPVVVPVAICEPTASPELTVPPTSRHGVRLLNVGRLQEFKGVRALVRAMAEMPDDVTLTFLGGDTDSAPGGGSMREHLVRLAGDDHRIVFHPRVEPHEVPAIIDAHHIVVLPSHFESFGYVAREALARNRPVVVTPVGGYVGVTGDKGDGGWTADGLSDGALVAALRDATTDRDALDQLIASGRPRAVFDSTLDERAYVERYLAMLPGPHEADGAPAVAGTTGAITAVVRVAADRDVLATLDALDAQVGAPAIEVTLVCDVPEQIPAAALGRAHDLEPIGEDGRLARSLLARRDGTGPVLFIDAGVKIHPDFVARGLAALRGPSRPASFATYGSGRSLRDRPLNNVATNALGLPGLDGGAVLVRSDVLAEPLPPFSPTGRAADAVVADLAARGAVGTILPEPLTSRSATSLRAATPRRAFTLVGDAGLLADD